MSKNTSRNESTDQNRPYNHEPIIKATDRNLIKP